MITVIVVFASLMAATAILMCVALYRGWLRLAAVPVEDKMVFVLMDKKGPKAAVEKVTKPNGKDSDPVSLSESTPETKIQ
jgi:hypothetical protein